MQDILNGFKAHDLQPDNIICDGKIHRFKVDSQDNKKSGYYVGYQNHTRKGEVFNVVVGGNYKTDLQFTVQTGGIAFTAEDQKLMRDQIAKAKAKEASERAKIHEAVSQEITQRYNDLLNEGESEYLKKKQITGIEGIKYDKEGSIYIPLQDFDKKIWSWQKIDKDGNKFFFPGGRVQGCHSVIGGNIGDTIYFAEGFSTSASIALAVGSGVVCCLSATNIDRVVAEFRKHYPDVDFVICGDDDRKSNNIENTGRIKATEAAQKYNATAIFPVFKNDDPERFTDFSDLLVNEGISGVREQLVKAEPPPKMALYSLGFKNKTYFFRSTSNPQIVEVSSFSEDNMLNLMPIEYWEMVFPGHRTKVDWTTAKSVLMEECRKKGLFNHAFIRGAGVWEDQGRIVINMGDHLIVNGKKCSFYDIKSRYFYILGFRVPALNKNPLTAEECKPLIQAAHLFKWKKEDYGYLVAGAMVTMRVCGGLPIRPHLWMIGERGSGKTTLFNRFIDPLLGQSKLTLAGNSTEAGIRQAVHADARPVMIDEFESNTYKNANNVQEVLDICRVAWSETNAVILKGSASGAAMSYQVRFSAIVTSITQKTLGDADQTRFATIELMPHDNDPEHWETLSGLLEQITPEYGERLFARIVKLMPVLLENFKIFKKAFNRSNAGQRFSDQYGMLLAGYALLLSDEVATTEDADFIVSQIGLQDARELSSQQDHIDCLNHLLTTKVRYDSHEASVGELIFKAHQFVGKGFSSEQESALKRVGIRVSSTEVAIASSNHAELAKLFKGSRWEFGWSTLDRIDGASRKKVRFDGLTKNCIVLPMSLLE